MNKLANFYIQRSIGVIICLMMSLMLFCVSCYDDEDLQQYVSNIDERLTLLETTLKNVQEDMSSVKALAEALEENLTIASILEDAEGNYIITLSNDKVLKIRNSVNGTPMITIQEEGGVYYWATDLDGTITILKDKSGNKMKVTADAPEIRINESTYEWEISVDGGKSWQSTGVVAGKDADCSIFSEVTQDDKYAFFTLVDGSVIKLPKSQEFKFDILGGKQYFKAGEEKQLKIKTSGVDKYTIAKPDGWKVDVGKEGLKITAPISENVYAEQEGKITVVAVSFSGQSLISEIPVVIGTAPVVLNLSGENVTATMNGIKSYYMGVMESSVYTTEAVITLLENELERITFLKSTDFNGSLAEIDPRVEILADKSYVVWVIPNTNNELLEDDVLAEMLIRSTLKLNLIKTTAFNADIEVIMENCDSYFMGIAETADYDVNLILEELSGAWASDYELTAGGIFSISDIPLSMTIVPGKSYVIWGVINKPSLTEKDIIRLDCVLPEPEFTGQATVKFTNPQISITEITVQCEPSRDAVKFYYDYLTEDKLATYADDKSLILDYLIKRKANTESIPYVIKNLNPETKIYLVAVALDKDGKLGPLTKEEITTLAISYDGTASATATVTPSFDSATFTFTPTGTPAKFRYVHITKEEFEQSYGFAGDEEKVKRALALNSDYRIISVNTTDLVNNKLVVSGLKLNTAYEFFVLVEDESGQLNGTMIHLSYATNNYTIIRSSAENYKIPTVMVNECVKDKNFYTLKYTITPVEGTAKMYVRYATKEVYNNQISWKDKHNYVLNIPDYGEIGSGIFEGTSPVELTKTYASVPGYIMVICVTTNGEAYEVYNHEVPVPPAPETSAE